MAYTEYTCREAKESDLAGIAELFQRHNLPTSRVDTLVWKYFRNPDGPAKIYIAEDSEGTIVATRIYLPRMFTSQKTGNFLVRQSVDLLVAEEHRGTGVYSKVRQFQVDRRDYPAIGFPNEFAKQITRTYPGNKRVYYPLVEWRFPVQEGLMFQGRYRLFAPLVDILSRLYALCLLGRRQKNIQIKKIMRFEQNYELDPHFIHGIRSAEYLNWRFIDNPLQKFLCLEFLEDGRSLGYCVYAIHDSIAVIYDLALLDRGRQCLRLFVDHCRNQGISQLAFRSVGFKMKRYGFIKLGSVGDLDTVDTPDGDWLVTLADKD